MADMIREVLTEIFPTDVFITCLALCASEQTALVAQKFNLVLLGIGNGAKLIKSLVQPKIRNNKAEIIPFYFFFKIPECCVYFIECPVAYDFFFFKIKGKSYRLQNLYREMETDS